MATQPQAEALLASLQNSFEEAASVLRLKPAELVRKLLVNTVKAVDPIDLTACTVEDFRTDYVKVTLPSPIAGMAVLRTFKWRSPNNVALVDDQGNWTGVITYFREWEGFINAAREHVYTKLLSEANL